MPTVKTFPGHLRDGLFDVRARIHMPNLGAHGTLDFVIATGSPRTILSPPDAAACGIRAADLDDLPPLSVTDQFGRTFAAVEADAFITYYNADHDTHQIRLNVLVRRETDVGRASITSRSILALDAMRDLSLTVDARAEPPVILTARR